MDYLFVRCLKLLSNAGFWPECCLLLYCVALDLADFHGIFSGWRLGMGIESCEACGFVALVVG